MSIANAGRIGFGTATAVTHADTSSPIEKPPPGPTLDPGDVDEDIAKETGVDDGRAYDFSHLFRSEGVVSSVDMRLEAAKNYSKYVVGDEDVTVDTSVQGVNSDAMFIRGSRDRTAGRYEQFTDDDVIMNIGEEMIETVHGGVHVKAAFSAESIVGGAYAHTITAAYARVAAWADFLAWGGWAEVDVSRNELSLLMIRSHMFYAHAAGVRAIAAARLIDDFQMRIENFVLYSPTVTTYTDVGGPGGGITNSA